MMFADSTARVEVNVTFCIVISFFLGLWAVRAFTGKKAWPGTNKVPRIHLRGDPRPNAAPVPSMAAPLSAEFLLLAVTLMLDHRWHVNFGGTGSQQFSTSQNILGILFLIPLAVLVSLGVSGRPGFLVPLQYKTSKNEYSGIVATSRDDAPAGSILRPWLREHTGARVGVVTTACAAAVYYGSVSFVHVIAHKSTPPWWSLTLAALYAVGWISITFVALKLKVDESHPRRIFPSWMYGEVALIMMIPFFVAFSNVPTRYGNGGPVVPYSLQVIGKTALVFAALSYFVLMMKQAVALSRSRRV
jgi:hypothetical protein